MFPMPINGTLHDGQTLSAVWLNAYRSGIAWLLSASVQGRYPGFAGHMGGTDHVVRDGNENEELAYYMYHAYPTAYIHFDAFLQASSSEGTVTCILYVYDEDGKHALGSWTTTGTLYIAADLDAMDAHLHVGKIYRWTVALAGAPEHATTATLRILELGEQPDFMPPDAWNGWVDLEAGEVLYAQPLNDLTANMTLLRDALSPVNGLVALSATFVKDDRSTPPRSFDYYGSIRYHPDCFLVGVRGGQIGGAWFYTFATMGEAEGDYVLRYTSDAYPGRSIPDPREDRLDWFTHKVETDAWPYVHNEIVRWRISVTNGHPSFWCTGVAVSHAHIDSVEVGWQSMRNWAKGEQCVGHTHINAFGANLDRLYHFMQAPLPTLSIFAVQAIDMQPASPQTHIITDAGARFYVHMGVHRHRWLHYFCNDKEDRPSVRYGPNGDQQNALPNALVLPQSYPRWFTFDLQSLNPRLVLGNIYFVEQAHCVMEMTSSEDIQ